MQESQLIWDFVLPMDGKPTCATCGMDFAASCANCAMNGSLETVLECFAGLLASVETCSSLEF